MMIFCSYNHLQGSSHGRRMWQQACPTTLQCSAAARPQQTAWAGSPARSSAATARAWRSATGWATAAMTGRRRSASCTPSTSTGGSCGGAHSDVSNIGTDQLLYAARNTCYLNSRGHQGTLCGSDSVSLCLRLSSCRDAPDCHTLALRMRMNMKTYRMISKHSV